MSILNMATVEGFTAQDPVTRQTKNGKALCVFSVSVRHYSANGDDPKVSFIDIETWESLAKFCSENVHKGKRVLVNGNLRQDRWEDGDGKMRSRIKLIAKEVRFLDSLQEKKVPAAAVAVN
jgi:single-strand DNA-binding protein